MFSGVSVFALGNGAEVVFGSVLPQAARVSREHRHNTVIMSCLVSKVLLLYIYL